jgi:hypothetical protein
VKKVFPNLYFAKTEQDHAKGKPSSENLNRAKVKTRYALT